MPTQVDVPSDVGAETYWGLYGSGGTPASPITAVATNDGDTSVIYASSGGRLVVQLFKFPVLTAVVDPVTSASVTAVIRKYLGGVGGQSLYFDWNSVRVGTNQWSSVGGKIYHTLTYNAAGAGLALAVVNGEHGMEFSAAGGPSAKAEVWMTQFYRSVTYTPNTGAGGDFAFLIGSWAAAVIGPGLLMREMPALARYIYEKSRILILPSEYEQAFRDWKEA